MVVNHNNQNTNLKFVKLHTSLLNFTKETYKITNRYN